MSNGQQPPNPAFHMQEVAISIDQALAQLDQVEDMLSAILRSARAQLRATRNRALDDAYAQPRLELVHDAGWISFDAAAEQAGKSRRTIKRWVQTGRLQAKHGLTKREWVDQAVAAQPARTRKAQT